MTSEQTPSAAEDCDTVKSRLKTNLDGSVILLIPRKIIIYYRIYNIIKQVKNCPVVNSTHISKIQHINVTLLYANLSAGHIFFFFFYSVVITF